MKSIRIILVVVFLLGAVHSPNIVYGQNNNSLELFSVMLQTVSIQNADIASDMDNPSELPVTLVSFTSNSDDCDVEIQWETAAEENFDYYELQRSLNGLEFVSFAKIESKGDNSTYLYEDESLSSETWYYRLKMIDLDGSYEYSNIISEEVNCISDSKINIYPNPTPDFVMIEGLRIGKKLSIYADNGQLVLSEVVTNNRQQYNLKKFSAGLYTIVIGDSADSQTFKVVKN